MLTLFRSKIDMFFQFSEINIDFYLMVWCVSYGLNVSFTT